ncbi:MAG: ABC transporter ATP-binding protein [Verrucomicrobiales bacterium]|nr:ABC transporter ATP-binding protein [Verrucomicrobiales bacterium]
MIIPPPPGRPAAPLDLELVQVTKRFGSFVANDRVSLKIPSGTFHALIGENGAGKSTLVKCIMGFHTADEGDVIIGGHSRDIRSPADAYQFGIGMVYQHFTLVPAMTVAENLVLSRPDLPATIPWEAERKRLNAFMRTAPFQVDLDQPASQLAAGQKQKVEILKQLYLESRFLILDEPTSVLTPGEADEVLGLIRRKVEAGELSVLLISHKFREVFGFCNSVTVLRRGKVTGGGLVKDLTTDDLAAMMMGGPRTPRTVAKADRAPGAVALELKGLRADKDSGVPALEGLDLCLREGEVVGVAGVSGNGQRELVEVLAGQRPATGGEVLVHGEWYGATRTDAARHGVFLLPEEPLRNGCVPAMSVAENIAFREFDRPPIRLAGCLVSRRGIRGFAQGLISRFGVKTRSTETPIGDLSGGNVQRAVLARELGPGTAKVLIAANPCFGLDFAAVESIHGQITEARNRGVAVLLVSEDLDELLSLSDRLLVMSHGAIVHETTPAQADVKVIGHHMAGH